jgi:hypothetical protein
MSQYFSEFWQYLKDHDAPNWFVIFFSLIAWPLGLYWWAHRKRQSYPNFRVTFSPYKMDIVTPLGTASHDAVLLTFINLTRSTTYLSHARLREVQKNFPVHQSASRDAQGWREQTFLSPTGTFDRYECILHTDIASGRAHSAIAVNQPMDPAFYSYRPTLLRKWLRFPKYFLLEYSLVVGEKKVSVSTVY